MGKTCDMGGRSARLASPYARVAARSHVAVGLEPGEKFLWCSCGYSLNQPLCDGTHRQINIQNEGLEIDSVPFEPFKPLLYVAEEEGDEVWFETCQCKQSATPPFCDGAHNSLKTGPLEILATEFLPFNIESKQTHTHDTVRLLVRVDAEALPMLQYLGATVGAACHFSARVELADGSFQERPYTPISFDVETGEIELLVKRYPEGAVSPLLYALEPGEDKLELRGPMWGGFNYAAERTGNLALFAAGTGVTPVLQLAEAAAAEPEIMTPVGFITRQCWIYNANKTLADRLCTAELESLNVAHEHVSLWDVIEEGAQEGQHFAGRISSDILEQTGLPNPTADDQAVICGPPLFNRTIRQMLIKYGYAPRQIIVI